MQRTNSLAICFKSSASVSSLLLANQINRPYTSGGISPGRAPTLCTSTLHFKGWGSLEDLYLQVTPCLGANKVTLNFHILWSPVMIESSRNACLHLSFIHYQITGGISRKFVHSYYCHGVHNGSQLLMTLFIIRGLHF